MATTRSELLVAVPEPSCCLCGTPLQRSPNGTLVDGFDLHVEILHPTLNRSQERRVQTMRRRMLMDAAARSRR